MDKIQKKKLEKKLKQQQKQKEHTKIISKRLVIILGLIIAVLAFALYANTLNHGYVLDDFSVIKENYIVKQGIGGIPTILKTDYRYGYWNSKGNMYRPLSLIMFAVEWHFFPDKPQAGHFINVLLYALTGIVLFFTLKKILYKYNIIIPFVCCLLFISHPVHTEIVANIKSRDEILCFLFVLFSIQWLWKFLEKKKLITIIISLFFFLVAFTAKESTITFLAVIPLLIFLFTDVTLKRNLFLSALYLIPAVLYLGIRSKVLGDIGATSPISVYDNYMVSAHDIFSRTATAFLLFGKYLLLLVFPHPLISDYSYKQFTLTSFADYRVIITVVILLALGIYSIIFLKKNKLVSFGILYFFITFSLYSNLILIIGTCLGERLLYSASLGFALIIAFFIIKLCKVDIYEVVTTSKITEFFKKFPVVLSISGLIIIAYGFKTIARNKEWKNNYTLYSTDVKRSPNSSRAHYQYALSLVQDKALDEKIQNDTAIKNAYLDSAITEFKKAAEIYPYNADIYDQLGLAYFRRGDQQESLKYFLKTIELDSLKARPYSNMGIIYFNAGDYKNALKVYERAVKLDPRFSDGYFNLGSTYGTLGMLDKAINSFKTCLYYDPENAQAWYFLAITYEKTGNIPEAQNCFEKAYQINPKLRK
ncbi:MAG: tetratricopeptide repeat protein [Bacteroidia bacterium]|nr:tetratricopeptide repeat protein [Bacteroidia bacterium]